MKQNRLANLIVAAGLLVVAAVPSSALAASTPANTAAPTITGTAEVGSTLTADKGTWTGDPTPTYSYQWQACEAANAPTATVIGSSLNSPTGVAVDSAGNVYTANTGSDTITKITPGGTATTFATTGDGPQTIAIDDADNLYVSNTTGNSVSKITPGGSSSILASVTGTGPQGIAVDAAGNVYTANSGSNNVTKITPGGTATTLGATGSQPLGLVLDSAGNVFTANRLSNNITKITPGGEATTPFASIPAGATSAQPWGLAIDDSDNLYTANYTGGFNGSVSKITPAGVVTKFGDTGAGPRWIARDSSGNLYTTNTTSEDVTKLTLAGVKSTLDTGFQTFGIAVDSAGDIYVTSSVDGNVSKFVLTTCTDIPSATDPTYTPVAGDSGKKIRVVITATNASGSATANSATTSGVASTPANTAAPGVTGTAAAGQTLTASNGTWSGFPTPTFTYKWLSCDANGANCTEIPSATNSTYTLTSNDAGRRIKAEVTATNSAGTSSSSSTPSAVVTGSPGNSTPPSVSGTAEVGSTLTANKGSWSGYPEPTYAYQWQRCESGTTTTTFPVGAGIEPSDIVLDPSGNAYVSDLGSGDPSSKVFKVAIPAGTVTEVGTTGERPIAIARDAAGNTYTANQNGNSVTKIAPNGTSQNFTVPGTDPEPFDLAVDASGNIYVAAYNEDKLAKLLPDGTPAGSPWPVATGDGPRGVALDSSGNVYVTNRFSNSVTKVTPAGVATASWASTGTGPFGIAIDSSDNVFVANVNGQSVTKITPAGTATNPFASIGTLPFGIALDSSGNIYTANPFSDDVSKITPAGTASILGAVGDLPQAVAVGSGGKVYAANGAAPGSVTELAPGLTCTDIDGADDPTYTLTDDDEGKKIRVKVTGTNDAGSASANSDLTETVEPAPTPSNTSPPTITGTPEVGQELTADPGEWTGNPTFAYQWQRCDADGNNCTDIDGADESTYTLTGEDEGKKVRVKVTATNEAGSTDANSEPTATVEPEPVFPPENNEPPSVSGIAQQGQTLTADPGTWTGNPTPTFTYQWQRCEQGDPVSSILGTTGNLPTELIRDEEGNIYTANLAGNNVSKITPGGVTTTVGTTGNEPNSLVRDSAGNIYTSNQAANTVTKIATDGSSSVFSPTGFLPRAIVADDAGNLYTPNQNGGNVTKIAPDGTPSGTAPFYTWAETGPGTSPIAAVFDEDGNLYVANSGPDNVTKITPDGTASVFANTGEFPYDITIDGEGNLYTSNVDPQTVTKITPAGEASTLGTTGGGPVGIAVDGAGNVYTANQNHDTITQITPFGVSSTYASTGSTPRAVIVDEDGVLYTANFSSNDVSKIVPGELNCTDIDGATEEEYTAQAADVGKKLRVKVTATNSEGSETVESQPTATVVPDEVALTITKSGGTITSDPEGIDCGTTCTANFPFNEEVTLIATPDADKAFDATASECPGQGWDFDGDAYRCTVKADQALDVSISFRSPKTIWVNSGSTGAGGSCETPDYNTVGAAENAAIDGDTIRICEGEFASTSSGKDLTYEGAGAGKTVIVGSGEDDEGFYFNGTSSTVKNLTIRGTSGGIFIGGQEETLSVANVSFENNSGFRGAGIQAYGTSVEVQNSTFTGNSAVSGTAIWAFGPVTVVNSTISGNSKVTPVGRGTAGGFVPDPSSEGGMIVTNSFIESEDRNDITLLNVTLADNELSGSPSLLTLCEGEGPCPEGEQYPSGDIDVTNSIIAEDGTGCFTPYSGEVISGGGNVIQNTTNGCDDLVGGPPAPKSQVSASSLALQPLAVNPPGETATMALASSSVARAAAVSAECPQTDQRGVSRPASSCDSGAYQSAATPPPSGKPKIKVAVKAPKKVKAGKRFTIRVKTTNRAKKQTTRATRAAAPTTATKVKTCITLPRGVFVVNPRGGKVSGRKVCWTRKSLAAGKSVNYSVVVRSSSTASGSERIAASASASNSSGATAKAKAKSRVKVVKPKPKPEPKPPTG